MYQELERVLGGYGLNDTDKTSRELERLQSIQKPSSSTTNHNQTLPNLTKEEEGLGSLLGELQSASTMTLPSTQNNVNVDGEEDIPVRITVSTNPEGETKIQKTKFVM